MLSLRNCSDLLSGSLCSTPSTECLFIGSSGREVFVQPLAMNCICYCLHAWARLITVLQFRDSIYECLLGQQQSCRFHTHISYLLRRYVWIWMLGLGGSAVTGMFNSWSSCLEVRLLLEIGKGVLLHSCYTGRLVSAPEVELGWLDIH